MKKVLFGIIALSMAAFAVNPGDITEEKGVKKGAASVPVRVMAEVVKPASSLIITDEAGTILDELLLDHKIVGGSNAADSVIAKNFKVKVTGTGGVVDTDINGDESTHKVNIKLNKTATTLTKVGGTGTITSTLRLVNGVNTVSTNQYTAPLSGGEHLGTITSTIAAKSVPTAEGAYDNKVTGDMPTLSVTYAASGEPSEITK